MKLKVMFFLVLLLWAFFCCKNQGNNNPDLSSSATLYYNGDIITMEGNELQYAEAVVEQDGRIVFVGDQQSAREAFAGANPLDLHGQTLVPGLVHDAHAAASHLAQDLVAALHHLARGLLLRQAQAFDALGNLGSMGRAPPQRM